MNFHHRIIQKTIEHLDKTIYEHYVKLLSAKNPHNTYTYIPGKGIQVEEEPADIRMSREYFEGTRKNNPKAIIRAEALMKQEGANPSMEDHITPDMHEDVFSNLAKNMPKRIQH